MRLTPLGASRIPLILRCQSAICNLAMIVAGDKVAG